MKIIEIEDRNANLIEQLENVWERSVKATHLFLSDAEIWNIKQYIPQAVKNTRHLVIAENKEGFAIAFMGITEPKLEMLFISPEEQGQGLGKKLLQYGIREYSVSELTVNEQNPRAKGFYEHMGFKVYKRSDEDEQGNPYPILCMRLVQ